MWVRLGLALCAMAFLLCARADAVPNDVVNGFRSTVNCPSPSGTPCFVPLGGSSLTAGATATTGSFSASLTPATGRTASICGFFITSGGTTTALVVSGTVSGVANAGSSATLPFTYVFPSSGQGVLGAAFPKCIESYAASTNITVSVPGGGTGTTASLSVWGYQQ